LHFSPREEYIRIKTVKVKLVKPKTIIFDENNILKSNELPTCRILLELIHAGSGWLVLVSVQLGLGGLVILLLSS